MNSQKESVASKDLFSHCKEAYLVSNDDVVWECLMREGKFVSFLLYILVGPFETIAKIG